MLRKRHFAVVGIVLSWVSSGKGQTITEFVSNVPTVVGVFTTATSGGATFLDTLSTLSVTGQPISTPSSSLSNSPPTEAPAPSVPINTSSVSSPSTSASDDTPDPTRPHLSSPVALVSGVLAGSIVIFAAILVFFVARRRKGKRRRALLHSAISPFAGAAVAAARARSGGAGAGGAERFSSDSEAVGKLTAYCPERDHRRIIHWHSIPHKSLFSGRPLSPSSSSSSKSRSKSHGQTHTNSRQPHLHPTSGLMLVEDLELGRRLSTPISISPPPSPSTQRSVPTSLSMSTSSHSPLIVGSVEPTRSGSGGAQTNLWRPRSSSRSPSRISSALTSSGRSIAPTDISSSSATSSSIPILTSSLNLCENNLGEKETCIGVAVSHHLEDDLPPAYDDVR